MKATRELTVPIALLATALLPEVWSLSCHSCLGTRENCTNQQQLCGSNETLCMEETRATYGPISETLKRGCTTSQYCQSYFSTRRGFISRSIYCCSEDLCNNVPYNVTYSTERNGVECYSCIGSLAECDGTGIPSAQCRGKENRCVEISRQWLPGTGLVEPIIKGCGNYPKEETLLAYSLGGKISYVAVRVCEGSRCNNSSFTEFSVRELNGLVCYTCLDTGNDECSAGNLQPMNCVGNMDHCMNVIDYVRGATLRAGCANQQLCQDTAFYGTLLPKLPVSYVTCCQDPFCNGEPGQGERRGKGILIALLAASLLIALN